MSNELLPYAMHQMRNQMVAPVAQRQLDAWRLYAKRWILFSEVRITGEDNTLGPGVEQLHLVCGGLRNNSTEPMPYGACNMAIVLLFNGSGFNTIDVETLESLVVTHLRNVHRDLEEVVYNGTDLA